jgi:hypothetical protein
MFNRLNPSLPAAAALMLAAAGAQAVPPSSFTESRGYQACVEAAARTVQLVRMDSDYFIYDHDDSRRYYLNGYAFRDGDSERVKVACDTTRSGNRVLEVSVNEGSYAGRKDAPVNVARN